jgi:putative membrane protein
VLQDVLIDPVSLRGSKWFLGQIYYYPVKGMYFGVTLSNFLGWFLVGLAIIYCFQKLDYKMGWSKEFAGNALMGPVLSFSEYDVYSVNNILYRWVHYRND